MTDPPPDSPVTVETIRAMVNQHFPGSPSMCLELGPDSALGGLDVDPADIRPGGYVSGPTQFALADATLWYMAFVGIGRIEPMALTSDASIRFLRPAVGEALRCRATIESVSRRNVVGTFHVWCEGRPDKITATGQGTYALPL